MIVVDIKHAFVVNNSCGRRKDGATPGAERLVGRF